MANTRKEKVFSTPLKTPPIAGKGSNLKKAPSTKEKINTEQKRGPVIPELEGRHTKLRILIDHCQEAYLTILAAIRLGASPCYAFTTAGISPASFSIWYRRGYAAKTGLYRQFYTDILRAKCECVIGCEIKIANQDPKAYLRHGPGAMTIDRNLGANLPSWTEDMMSFNIQDNLEGREYREVDEKTMSDALADLERLGLLTMTSQGKQMFGPTISSQTLDGDLTQPSSLLPPEKKEPSPNGD